MKVKFPSTEYTDHSIDHPQRAIEILNNWLLDKEQKSKLIDNEWENFFLHAAVYLHDIGMIEHPSLPDPGFRDPEQKTEYIRKTHHERSHDLIMAIWRQLDIEDEFQAEIIARICLGHRSISLDDPRIRRKIPYRQTGRLIHLQFLAACVKLADELDLTFERTPFQIYELLPSKSKQTEIEWKKHFSVGGVGPHESYVGTICVWCRCRSAEIHRALKQHEAKVQNILNEINRHISPRFKYTQVVYEIENIGYDPIDYKFHVETSTALEIFMGNPIYSDKEVFLRELVQNALDACNVRRMIDSSVKPLITIAMGTNLNEITVRDNGIGMDREWIEKYFLPVGVSFYTSEDFGELGLVDVGFSPISCFGIGILSCFMVAEEIIIRTRKPSSPGLEIIIHDAKSYFDVREDDSIPQGTEVKVVFKDRPASRPGYLPLEEDCLGYLLKNVKCTQWPIEYIYYNGERTLIGKEPVSLVEKLKQRFWRDDWRSYIEVKIPFTRSEGYLSLKVAREDGLIMGPGGMTHSEFHVFQDGIYVCNELGLLPEWTVRNFVGRINLVSDERLELSISRASVTRGSAKYNYVRDIVREGVISLLDNTLGVIRTEHPSKSKVHAVMSTLVGQSVRLSGDGELRRLLRKHYCFPLFDFGRVIVGYFTYDELRNLQTQRSVVIFHSPREFGSRHVHPKLKESLFVLGEDARILAFVDRQRNFPIVGWSDDLIRPFAR
jgi:hypothetical protein